MSGEAVGVATGVSFIGFALLWIRRRAEESNSSVQCATDRSCCDSGKEERDDPGYPQR